MKKSLLATAVCFALAGCVTNQAMTDTQAMQVSHNEIRSQVLSGAISRSKGYELIFQKTLDHPQASGATRLRQFAYEMAIVARQLEAGEITQTQYDDSLRGKQSAMLLAVEADNREEQRYRETQRAQQVQSLQQTLQIMNSNQPQNPLNPSVRCESRNIGGTVYTNCR
jgi:hypothetical protein